MLEWRVYNAGPVPVLPPVIHAGIDRSVIIGGQTYLAGKAIWLEDRPENVARWSKVSGPGAVTFAKATSPVTTAKFSAPGDYVLAPMGSGGGGEPTATVHVHAEAPPPADRLDVVYTRKYSIDSPLWGARAKTLIVDWIPHCIDYCERTDIPTNKGDGGIDNFIEAGKANRGEAHAPHKGYVFSNAWVHQTVESMCIALMVDAHGDPEILAAQQRMRATLERWIPIILAAQMPDGYLQTAFTLTDRAKWPERWSPDHRGNHEGYVSGYFIESAINHYTLTDGKDLRLYNAAKKLADCWVANLAPARRTGSTATRRWSRHWCASDASSTTRKAIIAETLISLWPGSTTNSAKPPRQSAKAAAPSSPATVNPNAGAGVTAATGSRKSSGTIIESKVWI